MNPGHASRSRRRAAVAAGLVGLLAGTGSCWQTQPVKLTVTTTSVSSCPQRAVLTIGGASLLTPPAVTLTATAITPLPVSGAPAPEPRLSWTIDPADVTILQSGSLQVTLPPELVAGTYQVALTFSAADNQKSVLTPGSFDYSLDTPVVTPLVQRLELQGPRSPVDLAVFHRDSEHGLDLAVLGESGMSLSYYAEPLAGSASLPTLSAAPSFTAPALSGNLLHVELDPVKHPGERTLVVGAQVPGATSAASAISLFSGGLSTPVTLSGPSITAPYLPIRQQLVAAGYFQNDGGSIQLATYVGLSSDASIAFVYYKTPGDPSAPGQSTPIQTSAASPRPLAVATADLNGDTLTDAILIVDKLLPVRSTIAYLVTTAAQGTPGATQLNLSSPSAVVGLGDLDGDGVPDLVLGQAQPSGVNIYYNSAGKTATPFQDPPVFVATSQPTTLNLVDYDGDKRNDIVFTTSDGVHVLINPRRSSSGELIGKFDDSQIFSVPIPWAPVSAKVVELGGDPRPDLVVADGTSGHIFFLENSCILP